MKRIAQARRARRFWLKNALDGYDYVLLLPNGDDGTAGPMLRAFADRLAEERCEKALVLSPARVDAPALCTVRIISAELSECLLTLYAMYEFTDRLAVGSLERPYGRKLANLRGCGLATAGELARAAVGGGAARVTGV